MEEDNVRGVLQTTLANCKSLSPKISGLVRRFKAVSTLLLMRRDSAFADMNKYTKNLHNWVDEFDNQIRCAIHLAYAEKAAVIKAYREELEEEMSTLRVLLQESEKLLQVSTKFNAIQTNHGKTLITALKMMKTASCLETRDVDENLACLRVSTQLDWKNLPKLGQLVTCDISDENEADVRTSENKSCQCSTDIPSVKSVCVQTDATSVKSVCVQTDFVPSEKEILSESKASKSKNSSQRSKDNRLSTKQQNQRFIISQLEKGGISKQGTRGLSVSSLGDSINSNHRERGPNRRPAIRDTKFKPDTSKSPKRSVIKTEDHLGDIEQNNSKLDNPKSSCNVLTPTKNSQKTENCMGSPIVKTRKDSLRQPRPISLSPKTPDIWKREENCRKGTECNAEGRKGTDCNAEAMISKETSTATVIAKQLFDLGALKGDKTEKPNVDEEVGSSEVSAPVKDADKDEDEQQKSEDPGSKSNPTNNEKDSASPSALNTTLPADIPIKSEPITPSESIAPVVVEIKQELMSPQDLNNNNQISFNGNQNKAKPVLKCSSMVSKAESWESDEEIKSRIAERNASSKPNFTSDRVSAEKDMNWKMADKLNPSSECPSQTATLTSVIPLKETNSSEKSLSNNNDVPLPPPSLSEESLIQNSDILSWEPGSTEKSQPNINKAPHTNGSELHLNGVENELDCSVSDIPLPPPQESPKKTAKSHSNDVDNELDCSVSDIPLPPTEDFPKKTSLNSQSNDVKNELDCKVSDIPLPPTRESTKKTSSKSHSNDVDNELDCSVMSKSQDFPKRISTQNITTPCFKNFADSTITLHIREEQQNGLFGEIRGKKGNFSPVSAQLLFKVGTEDRLKYPIGVTTNGKGEILVADTGNHLVKMYSNQGKLLKSLGKEVHMRRPSAIVTNNEDEIFVKDDYAIHAFTAGGKYVKALARGVLLHPFGLDLTPDGLLVTLDTHRSNPRVVILSQEGTQMRSFPYAPLLHPSTTASSKCRFLAIQTERLIVSDLGTSSIYISDNYGETLFEFGEYGTSHGKFREPSGVTIDQQGHILVGDSKNDRIQIFKPSGSFLCDIEFDKAIQRPSDIHLTKDGKLYVTNFLLHQVFVYQLGQNKIKTKM